MQRIKINSASNYKTPIFSSYISVSILVGKHNIKFISELLKIILHTLDPPEPLPAPCILFPFCVCAGDPIFPYSAVCSNWLPIFLILPRSCSEPCLWSYVQMPNSSARIHWYRNPEEFEDRFHCTSSGLAFKRARLRWYTTKKKEIEGRQTRS